jgi:hypothetical protein
MADPTSIVIVGALAVIAYYVCKKTTLPPLTEAVYQPYDDYRARTTYTSANVSGAEGIADPMLGSKPLEGGFLEEVAVTTYQQSEIAKKKTEESMKQLKKNRLSFYPSDYRNQEGNDLYSKSI